MLIDSTAALIKTVKSLSGPSRNGQRLLLLSILGSVNIYFFQDFRRFYMSLKRYAFVQKFAFAWMLLSLFVGSAQVFAGQQGGSDHGNSRQN